MAALALLATACSGSPSSTSPGGSSHGFRRLIECGSFSEPRVREGQRTPSWSPTPAACARTACRTSPIPNQALATRRPARRSSGSAAPGSGGRERLPAPAPGRHCDQCPQAEVQQMLAADDVRPVHALPRGAELARPHRRFRGAACLPSRSGRHHPQRDAFAADRYQGRECQRLPPGALGGIRRADRRRRPRRCWPSPGATAAVCGGSPPTSPRLPPSPAKPVGLTSVQHRR